MVRDKGDAVPETAPSFERVRVIEDGENGRTQKSQERRAVAGTAGAQRQSPARRGKAVTWCV